MNILTLCTLLLPVVALRSGEVLDVPAVGTLRAAQVSRLGPQVSGRVAQVLVDVGDVVKVGQELVRLDAQTPEVMVRMREAEVTAAKARTASATAGLVTAKAEIAAAEADLTAAKAEDSDAQLQVDRMKALWEKPAGAEPAIPRKALDDALLKKRLSATRISATEARLAAATARAAEVQARIEEAHAAVALAEAGLTRTRRDLEECTIRAPFAGTISRRLVDPGTNATSAPVTDLVELQDTAHLHLECSLSQEFAQRVKVGGRITFTVEGSSAPSREAAITTVFPALDESTRSLRLRAVIDNADGNLRPGMLARVQVTVTAPADPPAPPPAVKPTP